MAIVRDILKQVVMFSVFPYNIVYFFYGLIARIPRIGYSVINFASGLRITKKCVVNKQSIFLNVESNTELMRANTYATKEIATLKWIDYFFKSGDIFYDIGANIGIYSLYAALKMNKSCKVYAFEPESLNYAKLNKNIVLNNLSGVILPFCLALSDELQFDKFYIKNFVEGGAFHGFKKASYNHYGVKNFNPEHLQGMIGVSVDSLISTFGLEVPNHIKIDVDGNEEQIINGMSFVLPNPILRTVLIEINENQDCKIVKTFKEHGFYLWNEKELDERITQNYIFAR